MYRARVFYIFIASPSDVAHERQVALDRIQNWNDNHSESIGVVLMPLTYERNTPSRIGSNPQDVIDKFVLDKADFLIAIFWSKIGSGATDKEIKRHVDSGKPAALLFSKINIPIDATDEVQHVRLLQQSYKDTSYYHQFHTDSEFIDFIDSELIRFVHELPEEIMASIHEDKPEPVKLSPKAKSILLTLRQTGKILRVQTFPGSYQIDSGRMIIYNGREAREWANWKDGVEELNNSGYIKYHMRLSIGDSYELTTAGWSAADELNETNQNNDKNMLL